MLLKPLGKVIHEGGTLIEEDSLPTTCSSVGSKKARKTIRPIRPS
jgi:hypothetical protein